MRGRSEGEEEAGLVVLFEVPGEPEGGACRGEGAEAGGGFCGRGAGAGGFWWW